MGAFRESSSGVGIPSGPPSGAAYVFVRSGTVWALQALLKALNGESFDNFGNSVSISGDTIVVGAPGESSNLTGGPSDNSAINAGAAYVFVRNGTSWTQQAMLKASNAEAGDGFGNSVAISGELSVVGAAGEDSDPNNGAEDNSTLSAGAAYVFIRAGTNWTQQALLKSIDAEARDGFGRSVAVLGNEVVSTLGNSYLSFIRNSAYIFTVSPTIAVTPASITAPLPGTLAGPNPTFTWEPGIGVSQYQLLAGSTGAGSRNLLASGPTSNLYYSVTLPTTGQTLYVRLLSLTPTGWQFRDYVYSAAVLTKAYIVSPAAGSMLQGSATTFNWDMGRGGIQFHLYVGSNGAGSNNLFSLNTGTATSQYVTGIPANGGIVYVRLWTLYGGAWYFNDYTYSAGSSIQKAVLVH